MFKRLLFLLIVIALLASGGYYGWRRLQNTVRVDPPLLVTVKRGFFVHEILERGNIDSARNTDIQCRVESASAGTLTILYVIPEGSIVEEGELLVELDSAMLRENLQSQETSVNAGEALLVQAEARLKTSEIQLDEYLKGVYEQDRRAIENRLFSATEQVRTLENDLAHYNRLLERGYITQNQVDAAIIELEKAVNTQEMEKMNLDVLENLTKARRVIQLEAAIASDKAEVLSARRSLELRTIRFKHLEEQLSRCKIYAPRSGQVVYYVSSRFGGDENLIREGLRVVERQILLQLPDPTQMQVRGLVNEANIRLVKPGQRATIRLEAFPNQVFDGAVRTVNDYPEQTSFLGTSMSKEYMVTVMVLDPPEGIKTGLTAEARIVVNEISNALLLPTQAVFAYGKKTYAVTYREGKWDKIEIKTGPANDKEVVILEGLNEGDEVVLGAWAHRDKINLPKIEDTPPKNDDVPDDELIRRERPAEDRERLSDIPAANTGEGSTTREPNNRPSRRSEGGGGGPRQ